MTGARAAHRAEVIAAIKRHARQQIAEQGAPNLSLRAIARELGVVSSAVYRYFPSRDDLITQLIIESYDSLAIDMEAAEQATADESFDTRWLEACRAARRWALASPSDYGLIFGTPIPGYAAPVDTIGPATRYTLVLIRLLEAMQAAGYKQSSTPGRGIAADLDVLVARVGMQVDPDTLIAGLIAWTNVFGTISFELFGHFHNVITARDEFFDAVVRAHGERIFARPPRRHDRRRAES